MGNVRGFTLLEVLIALGILALALPILLGLRNWDLDLHARAKELTTATILAQEKLIETELGTLLPLGETGGEFLSTPLGSQATPEITHCPSCGKSRFRFCGREGQRKKWSRSVPMSFRQAPQGSEGGFTLIEILLAVSLVAMMATLVFGSLYVTMSAIEAARANSANEQIVRSTLRVMTDELSIGVGQATGPWMGINGQQDGQPADSVAFLTMGQFRGVDSAKDTELVRIVYTREGDRLLRFVRRNLYGLTDESVEQVELATKVKGFNVRYYDRKSNLWLDEWDGRARESPKAMRPHSLPRISTGIQTASPTIERRPGNWLNWRSENRSPRC